MKKRILTVLAVCGVLVLMAIPFATPVSAITAPTVSTITPNSGHPGQSIVGVVITGTGFTGATAVNFSGSAVTTYSFVVNSDTQITARVNIAGDTTTYTSYNVSVVSGSTGTLVNGFSVTAFTPTYPQPASGATTTGTSVSITAFKNGAVTTGPVYVGDQINYLLVVSFPSSSSNYYDFWGGTLAVSFPSTSANHQPVAGYGTAAWPSGTPANPIVPEITPNIQLVAFCPVAYTVTASDAVSGTLTAYADYGNTSNYSGGINGIYEESTAQHTASATASISLRLIQPNTVVGISAAPTSVLSGDGSMLTVTESNTSNVLLTSPYVILSNGLSLTLNHSSTYFKGSSDTNNNSKLDPGETWEWDNVPTGALTADTEFVATGHGTDTAGHDVTVPTYPSEQKNVTVTVTTVTPPVPELPAGLLFGMGLCGLSGFILTRKLRRASAK